MRKLLTIITTAAIALLLTVTVYAAPTDDITVDYTIPSSNSLAEALKYDMAQYASDYIAAAEKYGVNVYFLCAKDALESGWGRYQAAPNNLGGWTSESGYMEFDSVQAYIDYSARNIKEMYLTDTGKYHTGYTLFDVGYYYNGSPEWLEEVGWIWASLERKCKK